jgi:SOS-response transcriptional repressor LexA
LRAIVALAAEMGYAPTVREIQQWTSASSTSIVAYRLGQLEQRGYIARAPGRSRAIRVLNDGGLA